ncbi:DUF309 domain-containing protein [Metallosphaera hakonensis]|uniref:DUF309 domain-containing protein n=1 Tax=Metallosphaera hakonensis JCM 8857 = DSM 7519 TaxID=1293036 RepID=A0A2U9IUM4_9CREN|nr:DUF309 domain-containing protein [Metallosphaera hakonensis]AWR99724.1 DUF309 domain-containing protein [Metallosphaera hakonensis JCM 8857 = DSM 7519]
MMERFILFYPFDVRLERKSGKDYNLVDIRECKYKELDVIGNLESVIRDYGQPLFIVKVGEGRESLWNLLNECRFWEAHEKLEEIWRRSQGIERKYLQALILICASMIKSRRNPSVSDQLMEKALSLISELPEDLLPLLYVRLGLNT